MVGRPFVIDGLNWGMLDLWQLAQGYQQGYVELFIKWVLIANEKGLKNEFMIINNIAANTTGVLWGIFYINQFYCLLDL